MSMPVEKPSGRVAIEEYFRQEVDALDKHEFHEGEILAMSGATYAHVNVAGNLYHALRTRLKGTPCRPLNNDMRVSTNLGQRYVYPDLTVICGKPAFDPIDENSRTLINPQIVFEVLSPSTERYDRGEKFHNYKQIETLREYVIVAQDRPRVDAFLKQADGSWNLLSWSDIGETLRLRSQPLEIPLAEIYEGVELLPDPPLEPFEIQN